MAILFAVQFCVLNLPDSTLVSIARNSGIYTESPPQKTADEDVFRKVQKKPLNPSAVLF
jgi:hypothetical protein